jgi:hypothetical protein
MGGEDEEFRTLLVRLADDAVAEHVTPRSASMAGDAARRGRRRVRARTVRQATAAVLAAGVLAGMATLPANARKPWLWHTVVSDLSQGLRGERCAGYDPYRRYLDAPPRGPLAGDEDFTAEARDAGEAGAHGTDMAWRGVLDDPRGDPHVVWAGPTPGGRAAVVVQRVVVHLHDGVPAENTGEKALLGYLATGADGALRVVAADYASYPGEGADPNGQLLAAWTDLPRRVLVVLDPGYPLGVSTGWTYAADGSADRGWSPVAFSDGVAVVDLPDDADPTQVRVARQPARHVSAVARVGGQPALRFGTGVHWWPAKPCLVVSGDADCGREVGALTEARRRRTAVGEQNAGVMGVVAGRTPDGRRFAVAGVSLDGSGSRVLGLVYGLRGVDGTERLVDAGPLDPDRLLPYAVRLPDGQGWVVAREGARLRYRSRPGEPWVDAASGAALLPDAGSLDVEVTPPSGAPAVVRLGQ